MSTQRPDGLPAFRPLGDRILVRRHKPEGQTTGGLFIPETAKDKLNVGEVLRLGPDVESAELVAGAVIVFGKYAETEITLEGEVFAVLHERDVFGVRDGTRLEVR